MANYILSSSIEIAVEQKPDLIITDLNMPRLNGIELTRKIRLKDEMAQMPIVAITAYGPVTASNAIEAGASAWARKPIAVNEFLPIIKNLLAST